MNALFTRFVQDIAPHAEALYILGDFFEYWAGDDDLADPFHIAITSALAGLAVGGTRVYLMFGNRDFLLSDAFMRAAQATLLPDPTRIDLYGVPTLLMHGDTLCTDGITRFNSSATLVSTAASDSMRAAGSAPVGGFNSALIVATAACSSMNRGSS